jgi:hypothetical protein
VLDYVALVTAIILAPATLLQAAWVWRKSSLERSTVFSVIMSLLAPQQGDGVSQITRTQTATLAPSVITIELLEDYADSSRGDEGRALTVYRRLD